MADEQSTAAMKGAPDHEGANLAEEETPAVNLVEYLAKIPGAPSRQQTETWKQQYGEVFVSGFNDDELFIFRPLGRREYVNLQKKLRTPPTEGKEPMTEYDYEEEVVKLCLLWKSVDSLETKGGTVSTLLEQIMMNSNFTNPQMASMLVMKL